jgi:hypothetical protein
MKHFSQRGLILSALFVLMVMTITPVTADVIFPAENYRFTISNTDEYPDYLIIAYPSGENGEYHLLGQDDPVEVSKNVFPSLYAVRRNDFNLSLVVTQLSQRRSFSDNQSHVLVSFQFKKYSSNSPPEDNHLIGVRDTYRIASINETAFILERTERIFWYEDGSEKSGSTRDPVYHPIVWWTDHTPVKSAPETNTPVSPAGTPVPSFATTIPATATSVPVSADNGNSFMFSQYLLIPVLAGCIIAAILIKRQKT